LYEEIFTSTSHFCFFLSILGCGENNSSKTFVVTQATEFHATAQSYQNIDEITLAPKSIQLNDIYHYNYFRLIYYTSFPGAEKLFPYPFAIEKWMDELGREGRYFPPEMILVTLVKRYDMPKNKFEDAVRLAAEKLINEGRDLSEEQWELPNADIIYTLDNEIINAYYRRENPMMPYWMK